MSADETPTGTPTPEPAPELGLVTGQRRLFFTAEGELDLGWALLLLCCLNGLVIFDLQAIGIIQGPSTEGWFWFGSFTLFCFLAGATVNRARLIAQVKGAAPDHPSREGP